MIKSVRDLRIIFLVP